MNKDKLIMTISIGFTALVLSAVTFTQFKTVEQTDITAIETMRETELRAELSSWKTKLDEVSLKLTDTQNTINQYKTEGIVITLQDNDFKDIESYELLKLVNELKLAGAEAISINEERIVSTSDITMINNSIILVNTRRISGPYIVKAIGDKKYLESAITIKGGYVDEVKANDKTISHEVQDNLIIPKYNGNISFDYAKKVEEEKE